MGTKERIDGIESRLKALERGPALLSSDAPPSFWVKNKRKLIGACVTLATLVLTFMGFWYPVHNDHDKEDFNLRVDARIDGKEKGINTKLGEMDSKLASIASSLDTLKPLIEDLIRREMDKAASLPQSEYRAKLPVIKHVLSAARQQAVTVNPKLVRQVEQKLISVQPRVPEFWPTSANLVSYRSFNTASKEVQQLSTAGLRNCTDSPPEPMRITKVVDPHTINFSRGLYENCRVILDSAQDDERINNFLSTQTPLITFKHCLVVYRGGPVNLIIAWNARPTTLHVEGQPDLPLSLSANALVFEECLFDFSFQGVPPPFGQQLTETLLAQNSPTLKLPHP